MHSTRRLQIAIALFACAAAADTESATASSFTRLGWQHAIRDHSIAALVGQLKNLAWIRDKNRNFIHDEIETHYHEGEVVDIVVDLNTCFSPAQIHDVLAGFGHVTYVGRLVTFVLLDRVRVEDLPKLAARPGVSMIEWQAPIQIMNDVASRAIQARGSVTFSPNNRRSQGSLGSTASQSQGALC